MIKENHRHIGQGGTAKVLAAMVLLAACSSVAWGADPKAALTQPTNVDFVNVPIQDVCATLASKHEVAVKLAPGVRPSLAVSHTDSGPLKAVLAKMLAPHGLMYAADETAIWIRPIPR